VNSRRLEENFKEKLRELVKKVSQKKEEENFVLEFRQKSLEEFFRLPMPDFGPDLSKIDFESIEYYIDPKTSKKRNWEDVPEDIKETFEKLGIPEAERKFFAGVETQFDSEVIYSKAKEYIESLGVIFLDTDSAIKKYPEIFKKYFGKIVPPNDNKFAALNSAFFSGGTFIFIPEGIKVDLPLQAYFWMNSEKLGQFERTLIIAEKDSYLHYIEGCTAPTYKSASLHAAVVEIFVGENAKVQYTTIQNWSGNIFNLVTKRALVEKNGTMEWVDGNIGSMITMKYPACILKGENSHGEMISLSSAKKGQFQDTGTRMIHVGENSTSRVIAKSICKEGGVTNYRGTIRILKSAKDSQSIVNCDSIILDGISKAGTFPKNSCENSSSKIQHEASASRIDEKKIFFLKSRGLKEENARSLVVKGFFDPIIKKLPLEYAIEMQRLIEMEVEGSFC